MSPRKRRLGEKFRSLYLWHRYAGIVAALLAAWLAITGILLNHAGDLHLDASYVEQEWLLDLYGVSAPANLRGRRIGDHWLVQSGDRIYLDEQFIATGETIGGAALEYGVVVAFRDRLQLYTPEAVLVEALPFTASTSQLRSIREHADGILLATSNEQFLASNDLLSVREIEPLPAVIEDRLQALPAKLHAAISRDVLRHSLSWERVLLDLHAGRVFGAAGRWLADLAGALLLLLAVTGVIVWVQRNRQQRRR